MKVYVLSFLMAIIAMVAFPLVGSGQTAAHAQDGFTIQILPSEGALTVQSPGKHDHLKFSYIAQDFIPIVTLAFSMVQDEPSHDTFHAFKFQRAKEYFLLI